MTGRRRAGFTLLEVVVAMTIGAVVLLGARALLDALGMQATVTLRSAAAADARANSRARLQRHVNDLVLQRDSLPSIAGDGERATFVSYCDSPHGCTEPCRVEVWVERGAAGRRVIWAAQGDTVTLSDSPDHAGILYLLSPSHGGSWTERWENTVLLPVALGIVMDRDTLFAAVGDRQ